MKRKEERGRLWRAVLQRDRSLDGTFVFAVSSTGVYCSPSCPARRPQRDRVKFFESPAAAERAGYRACRRCRPNEPRQSAELALVRRFCRAIETAPEHSVRLSVFCAAHSISQFKLQQLFQKHLGITPRAYADALRVRNLQSQLRCGIDVTSALYEVGYGSSSRLYERSNAQLGMTPATYRKGGSDTVIRYTIADSPAGRLLVAATERGIAAIYLGDSDSFLERALTAEFPKARVERDKRSLSAWVREVVRHLKGGQTRLDLPLDIEATAFQRRVWEALQRIPYGSTSTYGEIARSLGRPKAARAVARACATNPVSVAIPCHRVVREDGELGGYRWGIQRKRELLDQERAVVKGRDERERD